MQISKFLLPVCAAVCVISVRGGDNPAQIKAREALEQQLNQAPAQPPTAPPPPSPARMPKRKPMPMPMAMPQDAAPAAAPQADSDAIAKARQALEQQLNQSQSAPTMPAPQPAPAPILIQPPMAAQPAAPAMSPAPASDPEAIAKAREALRQKMQALETQQPATFQSPPPTPPASFAATAGAVVEPPSTPGLNGLPEANPTDIAKARETLRMTLDTMPPEAPDVRTQGSGLYFPPLQGPALPISAAKEQRLQGLLQQYKMDLISPEQYQAARAKILAEP